MDDSMLPISAERAFGVSFGGRNNANTYCPFHELDRRGRPTSNTPSCSINRDGFFHCKVCNERGTAVKFYAQRHSITVEEAVERLQSAPTPAEAALERQAQYKVRASATSTPLTDDLVKRCQRMLSSNDYFKRYLQLERGFNDATIARAEIGCDEQRITYPVRVNGELVNIRRYLPHSKLAPKMVSHEKGNGTPVLYPDFIFDHVKPGDELLMVEGEADALILIQHGFKAFTNTGGVTTWDASWGDYLATLGVRIAVMFDVHDDGNDIVAPDLGQRVAKERVEQLRALGINAKRVELPLPKTYVGGDHTDWFVKAKRSAVELHAVIDRVPYPLSDESISEAVSETEQRPAPASKPSKISLSSMESRKTVLAEASRAEFFKTKIEIRCLVAGKTSAPYLMPQRVKIAYTDEGGEAQELRAGFDAWDPALLSLIQCTSAAQRRQILTLLAVDSSDASVTVESTLSVEEIFVIPSIDDSSVENRYVMRRAFYVGHGLQTNQVYRFTGYTTVHPLTQEATHVFVEAEPVESLLENFRLEEGEMDRLSSMFAPSGEESVNSKMTAIARDFSRSVTNIRGRADLHLAVDLAIHSVSSFHFDGQLIRKGWIECLIIGDTRTGKGFVTEGLLRHYRVGDVVSGENVTLAGLIGGIQKVGDRWTLVWGKLPLNDRRLVVIDEASSLSIREIGALSRVRSEGVAEITKIISEKTTARTRLIWLSNPRAREGDGKPRMMSSYQYGIQAVPELMGTPEDVARFDYVFTVAQSEVSSDVINIKRSADVITMYDAENCHRLICWAWSRKPEQVVFEHGVVDYILRAAKMLGRLFAPSYCLVQSEDVRFKLARIACAAAARTFSTDDGERLIVREDHAAFAFNFIHHIYSKPSNGYMQASVMETEQSTLREDAQLRAELMETLGDNLQDFISCMLHQTAFRVDDICDATGLDPFVARSLISTLVRQRAVVREYDGYRKRPAFRAFLLRLKSELARDDHLTQEETHDDLNESSTESAGDHR